MNCQTARRYGLLWLGAFIPPQAVVFQRPYNKGAEEYYNDIYERYARGEFVHEDSINSKDTTNYHTSKGRRVYGGVRGIHPDIFVPG